MKWDEVTLRQYLLGELPEAERETLEFRIFTDQELVEALSIAEDELAEDYLDNMLSQAEFASFNRLFLASPGRQERLQFLQGLKTRAARGQSETGSEAPPVISRDKSFFDKLKNYVFFSFRPSVAFPIAALLFLGFLGYFIISRPFFGNNNQISAVTEEIIRLNQRDLSDLSAFASASRVSLTPGSLRDTPRGGALAKESLTDPVLLRLALPPGSEADNFQIALVRDGQKLAEVTGIRSFQNSGGFEIRLLIPSEFLALGTYRIEARPETSAQQDGGDSLTYVFSVR